MSNDFQSKASLRWIVDAHRESQERTVEHKDELRDLADRARAVLDLFPWPEDSPYREDGGRQQRVLADMRTPQQEVAERRLRGLRNRLKDLLGVIEGYLLEPEPPG
jgi:hypothetical protein